LLNKNSQIESAAVFICPTGTDFHIHQWHVLNSTKCDITAREGAVWINNVCSLVGYFDQVSCEAAGYCSEDNFADSAACVGAYHTWIAGDWTSHKCITKFLKNATEIMNDGEGNDNTLCESDETCLLTKNLGVYQGHGNIVSSASGPSGCLNIGSGGEIENVILMEYENNGY